MKFKQGYKAYADFKSGYYTVYQDIIRYPGAAFIIAWSFRGPGKTYSALDMCRQEGWKFIYMKRTKDDVDLITAASEGKAIEVDASPFVPINRDYGTNIVPFLIKSGFGAFYDLDKDFDKKDPIGLIVALSTVKSVKGVDFSDCDVVILDEFIPQAHEIVRKKEGSAFLDFLLTVGRDRMTRGKAPLKVILFANSEQIACPITSELEIIDHMAEMNANKESIRYLEDRGILLHHILPEEAPKVSKNQRNDGVFKAMKGTQWAKKAYEGLFANNDFSNVRTMNIKRMQPYCHIRYKNNDYYIYTREDGQYYMCFNKAKCPMQYDLNRENDQKLFWAEECQSLRVDCMEGRFAFQKYSMYDLIINYKNYFKI